MVLPRRIYPDANIFILMAETAGEVSELLAELVLSRVRSSPFNFYTSELTIAETFVRPL
jgi:hypothetical protein